MTDDITDEHPPLDRELARVIVLTDSQIDAIAERVEARFYARVGRKVVERALTIIGISVTVLLAYLGGKGLLK